MEKPARKAVSAIPEGVKSMTAGATADIKADKEFMASISQPLVKQIQLAQKLQQSPLFQHVRALPQFSAVQAAFHNENLLRDIQDKAAVYSALQPLIESAAKFDEAFQALPTSKQEKILGEVDKMGSDADAENIPVIEPPEEIKPEYIDLKQAMYDFLFRVGEQRLDNFVFSTASIVSYIDTYDVNYMAVVMIVLAAIQVANILRKAADVSQDEDKNSK